MQLTDFPRNMSKIADDIEKERQRQNRKWGIQTHDVAAWFLILAEEYGEACKAANEVNFRNLALSEMRQEIIEMLAVGVSIVEGIDSR